MNTSLQNIITREKKSIYDSDIGLLFKRKAYPCFELADFNKNTDLMKK